MDTTLHFEIQTRDAAATAAAILERADEATVSASVETDTVRVSAKSEYVATLMRALDLDADEPGAIRQFIYNNRVRLA